MRVCLSIHRNDLDKAFESYDYMSDHYFTHATPTLFNAGSNREQFASCFLSIKIQLTESTKLLKILCFNFTTFGIGVLIFIMFGLKIHLLQEQMVNQMGLFQCFVFLMIQLATLTNVLHLKQLFIRQSVLNKFKTVNMVKQEYLQQKDQKLYVMFLSIHMKGDIYEIDTMHSLEPLKITDEHPVYCLKDQKRGLNYSVIKSLKKRTY